MTTKKLECLQKPITLKRMKEIIKKNKLYFSLYRGKVMAFDVTTGEFVRWDNTMLKMLDAIKKYEANPSNLFVYQVPLTLRGNG